MDQKGIMAIAIGILMLIVGLMGGFLVGQSGARNPQTTTTTSIVTTIIPQTTTVTQTSAITVTTTVLGTTTSTAPTEKLVISAYPYYDGVNATQDLVFSITNDGSGSITITQIQLNGVPIASAAIRVTFGFTPGWSLASGATGTFVVYNAAAALGLKDGIQYPITLVTALGNSYPATITWP